ncbi:hypothetical protein [Accumulibacter sp.]|uniref:hypothetical protein n=1 Tax=Accumulibacter sp. TaxID=2053492 RepID=UPI0028C4F530|nr:hypothetical protein [Accumulibacter sp.]
MSQRRPNKTRLIFAALAILIALLAGLVFLAWQHFYPVTVADGWSSRVFLDELPYVSALARDKHGLLYVTQELNNKHGNVFTLDASGARKVALAGLSKPDGLASFGDGMVVSQEGGEHPLLWIHGGEIEALFVAKNAEGIATDGRFLYVIEDRPGDGRLLRFDPSTKVVTVLREGLHAGEGVAVCPDGQLYYAEKGRGWVKRWRSEGRDEVVLGGLNAPGFLMCNDEGLWVTEDATHRARLLLLDRFGSLQVILKHLRSAQTVLSLAPGHLLIAEQGRGRVLELTRLPTRPE